ncbi:MAG: nitroreductase family protein [Pseudomonadota bacterium]|nr:nitroreductase family protein [Pseudomonadota bacterium]
MMESSFLQKARSFEDVINSRVTIHDFKTEAVPREIIDKALLSFAATPNHFLTKPWRIYVLGKKCVTEIVELNSSRVRIDKGEKAAQIKRERWAKVPCWILVNCTISEEEIRFQEDYAACACGIQNMMLTFWSNGYGTKWTTGPVTRYPDFPDIVGFDSNEEVVVGLLWAGLPNTIPEKRARDSSRNVTWLP